ncbi:MAG: hypothetical protein V7K77_18880 [Nostoc sp.]|uniref:hypothetical protein n=1 Tax=Nostoc sp. TaxID=1180 RepID=UPI002FF92CC6
MIDQSLQYYNGDFLGFVPQPKRQERDGVAQVGIALTTLCTRSKLSGNLSYAIAYSGEKAIASRRNCSSK